MQDTNMQTWSSDCCKRKWTVTATDIIKVYIHYRCYCCVEGAPVDHRVKICNILLKTLKDQTKWSPHQFRNSNKKTLQRTIKTKHYWHNSLIKLQSHSRLVCWVVEFSCFVAKSCIMCVLHNFIFFFTCIFSESMWCFWFCCTCFWNRKGYIAVGLFFVVNILLLPHVPFWSQKEVKIKCKNRST